LDSTCRPQNNEANFHCGKKAFEYQAKIYHFNIIEQILIPVHPDAGLRCHHPTVLHHHGQARHSQDADADRLRQHVQELLYHHGYVPPHHMLRTGRCYPLRVG